MGAEPDFKPIRARLSTFDTAMVVFSLVAGIVILLTGWPLFRLGRTLFGPAGRST